MLSVVFAESYDNFAHLLRFYAPKATEVLDVTYGAGTLVKRVPIPVIGVDSDPSSKASVIADSKSLPFSNGSFTVSVYDPPYLYGSSAMHMGPIGQKTWSNLRSTWKKPDDLIALSNGVAKELYRVLQPQGINITKIMDSRYKGKLVRNHDIVTQCFESCGFLLRDQIVYIPVTGSFVNPKSAQSAHGYFLIFEKV